MSKPEGKAWPDRREWKRKYYEENKEKLIAQAREWVVQNRERRKAWHKEYYAKNGARLRAERRERLLRDGDKIRAQKKSQRDKDPAKGHVAAYHRELHYGVTNEEYIALLDSQQGCCAICESPKPSSGRYKHFCVDHDHNTGRIRGLLCMNCNITLGRLRDDPEVLRKAADYLERTDDARSRI